MRDTGEPTQHWAPLFDTGSLETLTPHGGGSTTLTAAVAQPITATEPVEPPSKPIPAFAPPEVVPGTYAYLKRWTFVVVLLGVWVVAGAAGAGLYEWWFAALDKTAPVFVTLVWVVLCTVGGLIASTAPRRPLLSALGIALMSSPLASTVAAAVLYGSYVFGWFGR